MKGAPFLTIACSKTSPARTSPSVRGAPRVHEQKGVRLSVRLRVGVRMRVRIRARG